jgi:hypothetical protein
MYDVCEQCGCMTSGELVDGHFYCDECIADLDGFDSDKYDDSETDDYEAEYENYCEN